MLPSGRYDIIHPNVLHVGIDLLPPDQEVWSSMIRSELGAGTAAGVAKLSRQFFTYLHLRGHFSVPPRKALVHIRAIQRQKGCLAMEELLGFDAEYFKGVKFEDCDEEKPGTSARDAAAVQGETEAEPPSAAKDSNGRALSTTPQRSASTARAASTSAAVTTTTSFVTTVATQASLPSRAAVRAFTANESKDQPDYVVPTR